MAETTSPPMVQCPAHVQLGNLYLGEPMLIPCCLIALFLGVYYFFRVGAQKDFTGHISYSITFLLYGIMMTTAFFVHCIFSQQLVSGSPPFYAVVAGIADVGLTSCIGLSWSFNGLVDVGVVKEGWKLFAVEFLCFAGLIVAWTYEFFRPAGLQPIAFVALYFGPILISAIVYSLCQLYRFLRFGETAGWYWFLLAEISAFIGVVFASDPTVSNYFCTYLGPVLSPWFNADFWWFLLSDVSMLSYALFFIARTIAPTDKRGYSFHLQPMV